MTVRRVTLPYGEQEIEIRIPEGNLIGVFSPHETAPVTDVRMEVRRALAAPIGSPPLQEQVRGKKNVVLIADDNTRLTPTDVLIPILLDECNAAGVSDSAIAVIIALGTHRPMTDDEILAKFGAETLQRVAIRNHPYKDPDSLVDLGITRNGGHILINRAVVEADFKMGIGSIVPHHIPGFAGGSKIIQPGVSGEDTTAYTHLLSVRAPRSYLGVLDNPVREELDAMARKVGMNTIFNTVLNRRGEVVQAFFGDVVDAFRAGVAKSREVYEIPVPEAADIVLAGSHPCDLDFWQAHKTLYPSDLAVKAGGIVIVVTPCSEGVSKMHGDILELTSYGSRQIRTMVSGKRVQDEVGAALAIAWAQVKEREEVWIVSDGICEDEASKLGFRHFTAVQNALDEALAQKGPAARVTVLTQAPDMLPRITAAMADNAVYSHIRSSAHIRSWPKMKAIVSIKDVVNEMDALSEEHSAFLNRNTGELVTLSSEELSAAEEDDDIVDYPEWQQEMIIKAKEVISSDDYLPLPSKFDIHEYHIMEDFCCSVVDDKIRRGLLDKIRGRGAFKRFKDAIQMNGIEEEWYRFRQEELEKIAIDWLEANHISYVTDEG